MLCRPMVSPCPFPPSLLPLAKMLCLLSAGQAQNPWDNPFGGQPLGPVPTCQGQGLPQCASGLALPFCACAFSTKQKLQL